VLLPSAFTPDGDGLNDVFRPLGLKISGNVLLCIYNMWGEKIFQTTDVLHGWDGKIRNTLQASGTYIWTFTYTDADGKSGFLKGPVVLLR